MNIKDSFKVSVNGQKYATYENIQNDYLVSKRTAYRMLENHFPNDIIVKNIKIKDQKQIIKKGIKWEIYKNFVNSDPYSPSNFWYESLINSENNIRTQDTKKSLEEAGITKKEQLIIEISKLNERILFLENALFKEKSMIAIKQFQKPKNVKELDIFQNHPEKMEFSKGPAYERYVKWTNNPKNKIK